MAVCCCLHAHPDPGSLVNVRTLGAKSLPIQEVFEAFFKLKICCYVFTLSLSQWPEVVFQHNKLLSPKSGETDHLLPTAWKLLNCGKIDNCYISTLSLSRWPEIVLQGGSEVNPNTLLSSAEPKRFNRSLISFQGAWEVCTEPKRWYSS